MRPARYPEHSLQIDSSNLWFQVANEYILVIFVPDNLLISTDYTNYYPAEYQNKTKNGTYNFIIDHTALYNNTSFTYDVYMYV